MVALDSKGLGNARPASRPRSRASFRARGASSSPRGTGGSGRARRSARPPTGSGAESLAAGPDASDGAPRRRRGEPLASARPRARAPSSTPPGSSSTRTSGRAPLAVAAREAVLRAAGYSTLELDLATGGRGKRGEHVRPLLLELFAPGRDDVDALAVTNAAAALLLALDTLANGRPVAVSRGELVAIGGDFRVPSILARSGATLLEVGTTNRTTPEDYAEALRAGAAAVLKVRPSNYRIVGFTEEVGLAELAALCREARRPAPLRRRARAPRAGSRSRAFATSPSRPRRSPQGADLVCFSGDKTLGGPQAGILLGAAGARRRLREEPARARPPPRQARPRRARGDARPAPLGARRPRSRSTRMLRDAARAPSRRARDSLAARGGRARAGRPRRPRSSRSPAAAPGPSRRSRPSGVLLRHPAIGETEAAARLRDAGAPGHRPGLGGTPRPRPPHRRRRRRTPTSSPPSARPLSRLP